MFSMQDQHKHTWWQKKCFDAKPSNLNRETSKNELKKLKTFDSSYFKGESHFEADGTQNYLVFQLIKIYFKKIDNKKYISSWKSKELSDETIKPPATCDNRFSVNRPSSVNYLENKVRVKI